MVPIRVNKASFSAIGRSWPSQNNQPLGGKLPANSLISPIYASDIGRPPQERDGKIPCKAITKLIARKGDMLLCGWLPPTLVTLVGWSGTSALGAR